MQLKANVLLRALVGLSSTIASIAAASVPRTEADDAYDYIVVGSGPGGGVAASNLARAGFSVMLIEAGRDASNEISTLVSPLSYPGLPNLSWRFFVKHFADPERQLRNNLLTWQRSNGSYWVGSGANAPDDATLLGVYYPRGATLGGSAMVNAMGTFLPNDADWNQIANLTDDPSWQHENMREVFTSLERNHYVDTGTPGHGFSGFMDTRIRSASYYNRSPGRIAFLKTQAKHFGLDPENIFSYLERDANYLGENRDGDNGPFGLPFHETTGAKRWSPRDLILATANATAEDGSKKYDLKLQLDSLATRVLFANESGKIPRAIGVEFLEGSGTYKATYEYNPQTSPQGILRRAYARKELIVSGGTFNSPQLLQLSGIGDRAHLTSLGINVIVDLPGVGRNLQDNQELPVVGRGTGNFTVAPDPEAAKCTSGAAGDPCIELWKQGTGPYVAPGGNSECALTTSKHSPDGNRDVLTFMPPNVLRGFFIRDPSQVFPVDPPNTIARSMVRMQSQNRAGYVLVKSKDPRDTPDINFEHFGNGADLDIGAMTDTIAAIRRIFSDIPAPYGPVQGVEPPCPAGYGSDGYCSVPEQDKEWIRDQTFGHHPTGTCAIGSDDNPHAVLDSKFRVRGVNGLRVVDASVFPQNPGAFPVVATVMIGQKASRVILEDADKKVR